MTNSPGLCVFDGTPGDRLRFLSLWNDAELTQVDLKLLTSLQKQLPKLCTDLESHTAHRASKFRELYGLVCGSSPVALKDFGGSVV
ncbi:unnamed protein product [Echinostoma caproni]|uniref:Uncharacterized protein n=1 Tax=Echinostoma caproni TaxID=27848 RepID=A0A3P8J027_9TREM|nr:unnamed protein product [Echinostoma caproni]